MRAIFGRLLHKVAMIAPGGFSLRPWLHRLRGAQIGKNVWISQLVYLDELHPECVTIGDNSTIGLRTSIFSHFYWGPRKARNDGCVIIERDVFVGPHCVILPNVRIGQGAVIKAGTVVSKNVPPGAILGTTTEVIGIATVPLTEASSYHEFAHGVRPFRRSRAS